MSLSKSGEKSVERAGDNTPRADTAGQEGRVSRVKQLKAAPRKPGEASFFYADHHFQCDVVKVLPGEYFVANDDIMVMTVLGSCIAACIWDTERKLGGMNHFMLPDGDVAEGSGRYGSYAMELLINEMLKLGAKRETMQAKVFGGAQVMASFNSINVGQRNTQFVFDYLATERISVVSQDVLDICPRKVCFFPKTGQAWVKRLAHSHPESVIAQDHRRRADAFAWEKTGGSVDLF